MTKNDAQRSRWTFYEAIKIINKFISSNQASTGPSGSNVPGPNVHLAVEPDTLPSALRSSHGGLNVPGPIWRPAAEAWDQSPRPFRSRDTGLHPGEEAQPTRRLESGTKPFLVAGQPARELEARLRVAVRVDARRAGAVWGADAAVLPARR